MRRGSTALGFFTRQEKGYRRIIYWPICGLIWLPAAGNEEATIHREQAATLMTPLQLLEARRLAREWQPTPLSIALMYRQILLILTSEFFSTIDELGKLLHATGGFCVQLKITIGSRPYPVSAQ